MSYCRWSSDNWKSDVYIYDGSEGITCHVTTYFYDGYIPKLPDITKVSNKVFREAYLRQKRVMESCPKKKHPSPMAGQTFWARDPKDMIFKLEQLQLEGFHVPEYVFEVLGADAQGETNDNT